MRQLARGDRTMMQHVFVRAGLLHHLAAEGKRAGRGERDAPAFQARAGRAVNVIKLSRVRARVVDGFARGNVDVAAAAVELHVALGAHVTVCRVIARRIGVKIVILKMDFNAAAQRSYGSGFLALARIDDDRIFFADRQIRFLRRLGLSAGAGSFRRLAILRLVRRRGDDQMAVAGLRLICAWSALRKHGGKRRILPILFRRRRRIYAWLLRTRLACYYRRSEKEMTKKRRCDNKLVLGAHAVENQTGKFTRRFSKTKPALVRQPLTLWRNSQSSMTCPLCGQAQPCA